MIKNQIVTSYQERFNNKGEADCCIWFHASKSSCEQILVANDTDVWMYGVALLEAGYLKSLLNNIDKDVIVELEFDKYKNRDLV